MSRCHVPYYFLLWLLVLPGCIATPESLALSATDRISVWREAQAIIDKKPRYSWGGHVTEEKGLDCSGFVYLVYRRAGIPVGRTTSRNMRLGRSGWDGEDLGDQPFQIGDLVFWTWRERPDRPDGHVGIIMNNWGSVEAAHSSARRGVVQDALQGRFEEDISARISIRSQ